MVVVKIAEATGEVDLRFYLDNDPRVAEEMR